MKIKFVIFRLLISSPVWAQSLLPNGPYRSEWQTGDGSVPFLFEVKDGDTSTRTVYSLNTGECKELTGFEQRSDKTSQRYVAG